MADSGVLVSKTFAQRIADTVRAVERDPRGPALSRLQPSGAPARWMVRGKLTTELDKDGSATMRVWANSGSGDRDAGEDLTVWDWLLTTGQSIASGLKVVAELDYASGRYYVIAAECG